MKRVGYKEAIQMEWLKFIQMEEVVEVMYKSISEANYFKLLGLQLK